VQRPRLAAGRTVGNLTLDTVGRRVFVGDKPIAFPARKSAVLEYLLRRSGKVVAKSLLEGALYGPTQEIGSNAVEVHVHRLRRHLIEVGASVRVHTVHGVGYMISESSSARPD
jgi:two-component system response regulator TctD